MAGQVDTRATGSLKTLRRSPIQLTAAAVGVVFLAVGILGFVPSATTNLSDIELVGHESDAELLGLFQVNILHNVVHLLFGVGGFVLARTAFLARNYLVVGGVSYVGLWLYGVFIDLDTAWNFVALNTADNWLHAGLGVGMVLLGVVMPNEQTR